MSKAIHGIVAARCGDPVMGYQFWRDGARIDLGDDPHSCDDGIHAAATGAIWLGAIQGFAGLSVRQGELHLEPMLPAAWSELSFPLQWQGVELFITISVESIKVSSTHAIDMWICGQPATIDGEQLFSRRNVISPAIGTATREDI